ncbi:MAG: TolC family protein [Bacteroidales bacterium]|nr:TolC family protein [Bacteroidales bacterium]
MQLNYKKLSQIILAVICLLGITESAVAQGNYYSERQNKVDFFNPISDNIADKLPPLEALLDSAVANSPRVLYEDLKTDYYRYEVKSAKRAWTEHFGFQYDFNYANVNWNDEIFGYEPEDQKDWPVYSRQLMVSNRYNGLVGAYMRFPLTSILDRKNRINKQKKWVEISMAQRDINISQVREEIIELYNQLLQNQKALVVSNDYQEWTSIQMIMAENDFLNQEISISEYTRLKEIQTRGRLEHEKAVNEYINAYDLLQEKTGMKFNLIKEIE